MSAIVLNGSFLLAAPIAVLAGLLSFASPCVLPLVPGYIAYVSGLVGSQRQEELTGRVMQVGKRHNNQVMRGVVLFVAGFSVVFVFLGWFMGTILSGSMVSMNALNQVLGIIVMIMGVVFLGGFRFLQRDFRVRKRRAPRGFWGAPVLGMIFAFSWTPCMGPVLATVYTLSLSGGADGTKGAFLLLMYCIGLGIPFILISSGLSKGMRTMAFLRRRRAFLMRFGGSLLMTVGLAMVTGWWGIWMSSMQNWLDGVYLPV